MPLRDYQQAAFDAATNFMKKSTAPFLVEAATGAGKSHLIAAIADWSTSQGDNVRVLCLQPSKELLEQNYQKFLATGSPASLYSASVGKKDLRHPVIFGTVQSVANSVDNFPRVAIVILDEAHNLTPTFKKIVDALKLKNANLRVMGLTATPYRMGQGYLYHVDQKGQPVEPGRQNRYFSKMVCQITARELLAKEYLTPPTTAPTESNYDAANMQLNKLGKFDQRDIEQAFEGQGRLTAEIVRDIVEKSYNRHGVLIFAATIKHANEVLDSLPPDRSAIITGKTKKADREHIIKRFKQKRIKYLVNVAVLTTGFDAPHVDVVAILRATESPGLLQQIIGRGLRLSEDKTDCLILDYAENIERHCPDGDIFNPELKLAGEPGDLIIKAECPVCNVTNHFAGRPNPDDMPINQYGYFTDLAGNEILTSDNKPLPAHFGRRCFGMDDKALNRCNYRWSFKECPDCESDNDIAARVCSSCGCELVDPNEKLKLEFARIKSDPYELTTDKVLQWAPNKHISIAGNETLRIDYVTDKTAFTAWYLPKRERLWADLCLAVFGKICPDVDTFLTYYHKGNMPQTITAKRNKQSKFFEVYGHNREETTLENI